MKVALVTPMPVASAIGRVMEAGAAKLADSWDIEIWCPDLGPRLAANVPVREYPRATSALAQELSTFDLVVYTIGDSPWHVEVIRLARELPGLVVLHDVSITNLIVADYADAGALDALAIDVEARYGEVVARAFIAAIPLSGSAVWPAVCARVPLIEHALHGSLGVVAHSAWAAEAVQGHTIGDVTVAPLPVPPAATASSLPPSIRVIPDDAIVLVTVGAVNPNRRIDWLLEAVASNRRMRERVHPVGAVSEGALSTLRAAADGLGMRDQIHATGRIDDGQLAAVLQRANLCAALRDPVLEAKSASLLSQMQAGKAVIVFDHAHYSEIPDEVVVKVPVGAGVPSLAVAMRRLVEDPSTAAAIGNDARRYVDTVARPRSYATRWPGQAPPGATGWSITA